MGSRSVLLPSHGSFTRVESTMGTVALMLIMRSSWLGMARQATKQPIDSCSEGVAVLVVGTTGSFATPGVHHGEKKVTSGSRGWATARSHVPWIILLQMGTHALSRPHPSHWK